MDIPIDSKAYFHVLIAHLDNLTLTNFHMYGYKKESENAKIYNIWKRNTDVSNQPEKWTSKTRSRVDICFPST